MMDIWLSGEVTDQQASALYGNVKEHVRANMFLALVDTSAADPLSFRIEFLQRYRVVTTLPDFLGEQKAMSFSEFPDRGFMLRSLAPAYSEARRTRNPVSDTVSSEISGVAVTYERMILPQPRVKGMSDWCLTLAEVSHVASPRIADPGLDDVELSLVQLLREGLTLKEIAEKTSTTHRTVEHRIDKIKLKVNARNLHHLVSKV